MGYAFISYCSKNRDLVDKIKFILNKNGVETWLAPDNIAPGFEYHDCIVDAIKNCSCFILLLSKDALESTWIPDEVSLAHDNKKRIIPVMLENLDSLGKLEIYIRRYQFLNVQTVAEESNEIQTLVSAVKNATGALENTTTQDNVSTIVSNAQDKNDSSAKSNAKFDKKTAIFVTVCIILLAIAIVLATALPSFLKPDENVGANENQTIVSSIISSTSEQTDSTSIISSVEETSSEDTGSTPVEETSSEDTSSTPVGENQLSSKYDEDIESLKYMDSMMLSLRTLRIKVGEGITPQPAQVWGDVTIYSQNTAIAIGDGLVVKGIAKGETYIVVQSNKTGMSQAFYVIVE